MKSGIFITLEGIEGAGKSTAVEIITSFLRSNKIEFIKTREPGGTEIAEKIRKLLLEHTQEQMHPATEMLLYFAARAQHLNQLIIPSLNEGKWVICDRFTDATYAYQGGGRGIDESKINILEKWVQDDLRPTYTLLFDIEPETGMARIKKNRVLDRLEVEHINFFHMVRERYLARATKEPKRFEIIDANHSLPRVKQQIISFLEKII